MQYKTVLLGLIIGCISSVKAEKEAFAVQTVLNEHTLLTESDQSLSENVSENDEDLDGILALLDEKGIQTPDIASPSPIMRCVRSWGISLLYKYYAVKSWIVGEDTERVGEESEIV